MPVFIRQNLGKVHILLAIGYISLFPKSIYQIYQKNNLNFFSKQIKSPKDFVTASSLYIASMKCRFAQWHQ